MPQTGFERAVQECFDFEFGAHTAEREVAQPELIDREPNFLAGDFEDVDGLNHAQAAA